MVDPEYAQFVARYVESAAYHEAGHMTAAAVQQMPLRERGVHVDPRGSGISYYWHRRPGDLTNSEQDRLEREQTIIAIYAGWVAQKTFFPDRPEEDWNPDRIAVCALLEEMHPTDPKTRGAARDELWEKAQTFVAQHWSTIRVLAETLLAKPWTPQPRVEIEENWSRGKTSLEKWMSVSEVVDCFQECGIPTFVRPDSAGKYNPPGQD